MRQDWFDLAQQCLTKTCLLPLSFVHGENFIPSLIFCVVARWYPTTPGTALFLTFEQKERENPSPTKQNLWISLLQDPFILSWLWACARTD